MDMQQLRISELEERVRFLCRYDPNILAWYRHYESGEITYHEMLLQVVVNLAAQKHTLMDQVIELNGVVTIPKMPRTLPRGVKLL